MCFETETKAATLNRILGLPGTGHHDKWSSVWIRLVLYQSWFRYYIKARSVSFGEHEKSKLEKYIFAILEKQRRKKNSEAVNGEKELEILRNS